MEIVFCKTNAIKLEADTKLRFKRKIDWEFLWDLIRFVFPTMCIDNMDMYNANDFGIAVLNPDYIYNFNNIKQYKKFLKEEGLDLRCKYRWDIFMSDDDDCDVHIIYNPFKEEKDVINIVYTTSADKLMETKRKLEDLDK